MTQRQPQGPQHRRRRRLLVATSIASGITILASCASPSPSPTPAAPGSTSSSPSATPSRGTAATVLPPTAAQVTDPNSDPYQPTADKLTEWRASLSPDPAQRFEQVLALGEADAAASYISTGPDIAKALTVTRGAVVGSVIGVDVPGSELLLRIKIEQSTSSELATAGAELDVATGAGFQVNQAGDLVVSKATGWTLAKFPPGQRVVVLVREVQGGVAVATSIGWLLVVEANGSLTGPTNWPEATAVKGLTLSALLDLVRREHA